jgi:uncharacterized protein YodC (DUF2158 family)
MKITTLIELGDIVYLRSGGVQMTVTALSEDGKMATVRWMNDKGASFKDAMPTNALIPAELVDREIRLIKPRKK